MTRHRFVDQIQSETRQSAELPVLSAGAGFMMCPVAVQQWVGGAAWQQRIYALALDEARAVVRPSVLERLAANLDN